MTLYGMSEGVIYTFKDLQLYFVVNILYCKKGITFLNNYIVVPSTDGKKTCVKMEVDKLDGMFIGAGDLFAALWIAWQDKHPNDLEVLKLLV